jgi:hypothetical protein
MSPPRGADKIVLDLEVMSSVPTCCLPTKKLPVRTLILVTPITVEGWNRYLWFRPEVEIFSSTEVPT